MNSRKVSVPLSVVRAALKDRQMYDYRDLAPYEPPYCFGMDFAGGFLFPGREVVAAARLLDDVARVLGRLVG